MKPEVAIIMGSQSDYETMKHAEHILEHFGVSYVTRVVSAHRTPDMMFEFAEGAKKQGIKVIIAGAGGSAHLPGMVAAKTTIPVLGVPIKSKALEGIDSLLSIVQMPYGIPVGTLAIGEPGAKNAALFACQMLAVYDTILAEKIELFRENQTKKVLQDAI